MRGVRAVALAGFASLLPLTPAPARSATAAHNFLVLVADDLGVERIGRYQGTPVGSRTPHIDALAAGGVLFRNAWSSPMCSPSRAILLTGRYGFRTGIGGNVHPVHGWNGGLGPEELTLPKLLADRYPTAAFGKWHLDSAMAKPNVDQPRRSGFGHFAGTPTNLMRGQTYTSWEKTVNGVTLPGRVTTYATSAVVDDALSWIAGNHEPWLVWIGFHAVHAPLHAPPPHLHSVPLPGPPEAFPLEHHAAMLEALDHEIGRLLAGLAPEVRGRTTVVFAGDNGTPRKLALAPSSPSAGKGTPYEGGLHVPLIVASPHTPPARRGQESRALVGLVDVFATLAEIAGAPARETDSVSLLPYLVDPSRASLRSTIYAEYFYPNGPGPYSIRTQAVRNARHKLVRRDCSRDELYDLEADPLERRDLLRPGPPAPEEATAHRHLVRALEALVPRDCAAPRQLRTGPGAG